MSVSILIYGAEKESDEYQAAERLKKIIKESLLPSVVGKIVLVVSATLIGQEVKDIDLMMIGELENCNITLEFFDREEDGFKKDRVNVRSFCTTIEVKKHDISGIFVQGTDLYVYYGREMHCVTLQSNRQKYAAVNFFKRILSRSPFITNLIWFVQATETDIDGLCMYDGKKMISNVLGNEFGFDKLVQLLIYQNPPFKRNGEYVFDCNTDYAVNDIQNALSVFSKCKEQMGELTRRRIEQISSGNFSKDILIDTQGKISIYRGRAGTGKTVGLIQTAIKLVDENQVRVLILTYNKALVSDIRRLFALAELPDMFEEKCVSINTMHSYFFKLVNAVLYKGKLNSDKFLEKYNIILDEMNKFLMDDTAIKHVREICIHDVQLDWDYILVDEAQDWSSIERDIILKLFDKGRIIVADGGQQFVRNIEVCDWSIIKERNNIKLKYCLRQKENIVNFLNMYSKKFNLLGTKILSNNNMPGGKIIIIEDTNLYEMHHKEMARLKEAGNIPYDMLYLVPHDLVKMTFGNRQFSKTSEFNANGIFFWDGTSSINRDTFSVDTNEVRVLQYESARGLEGWTVVCMDFDVFLDEKAKEYVEGEVNRLLLESPEERKKKYIYNWSMIPLTRAIDTIIITLRNKNSTTGLLLKELAEENPDCVSFI